MLKIVFACDGGMGSSAMGASVLRKKIQQAGLDVKLVHAAINEIPPDADTVISHKELTERAKAFAPNAEHISIEAFGYISGRHNHNGSGAASASLPYRRGSLYCCTKNY